MPFDAEFSKAVFSSILTYSLSVAQQSILKCNVFLFSTPTIDLFKYNKLDDDDSAEIKGNLSLKNTVFSSSPDISRDLTYSSGGVN